MCNLVGRAVQSLSHGSDPDFLPSFFPIGVFFRQVFSGLRSDSNVFVNCRLALFLLCAVRLDVIRGCSITYCYSSRCSAETAKINLMVFCSCCVLRSGAEIGCITNPTVSQ